MTGVHITALLLRDESRSISAAASRSRHGDGWHSARTTLLPFSYCGFAQAEVSPRGIIFSGNHIACGVLAQPLPADLLTGDLLA